MRGQILDNRIVRGNDHVDSPAPKQRVELLVEGGVGNIVRRAQEMVRGKTVLGKVLVGGQAEKLHIGAVAKGLVKVESALRPAGEEEHAHGIGQR